MKNKPKKNKDMGAEFEVDQQGVRIWRTKNDQPVPFNITDVHEVEDDYLYDGWCAWGEDDKAVYLNGVSQGALATVGNSPSGVLPRKP